MMSYYPINKNNPLVLASMSPRRKTILKQIGIPFEAIGSMVEETLYGVMKPADIACKMAILKAESVQHIYRNRWILGADTIVVMDRRIFGKPKDNRECRDMLLHLRGKNHRVITGFCIVDPGGKTVHIEAVITKVKIKEISEIEIEAYIKTGEPFGKAGGYAIQGIGSFMIEHINGSYTNVVGLPICEVVNALVTCGSLEGFPLIEQG
jgi:septum formation protein